MSTNTLNCLPIGICSWDYELMDENGFHAKIMLNHFGDQGSITIDNEQYIIEKPSFFRGEWNLKQGEELVFSAEKLNPFTRAIDITRGTTKFKLKASSALIRDMELHGSEGSCVMAPHHPFTRRASITGEWEDFRLVAFGFWLTALAWRRAAQSD